MSYKNRYQGSINRSVVFSSGIARSPGSKSGVGLEEVVTSRKFKPSPKPAAGDTITITGGTYSLDGGSFTSNAGTWGAARYIQVQTTSSADYETTVTATITIGGVAYAFNVTTVAVGEIPSHIKLLWRAGDTLKTLKGPSQATSYTGSFTMPDGSTKTVPVDATKGLWVGPGYTNLFTGAPTGAEVKALTAQKYCLQCVGGSVDAGAYGTATPSAPLIFTASAGNQTFTPTGCSSWMLSAVGGYVFPYLPPGITNPSAVGTSGGNGASWPLTGSDSAERLVECLRGKPDGVELVASQADREFSSDTGWWAKSGATTISGGVARIYSADGSYSALEKANLLTIGARYLLDYYTVAAPVSSLYVDTNTPMPVTIGRNKVEFTATSTTLVIKRNGVTDVTIDNISIQKLNPAIFTIGALCYIGAGSAELPAANYAVLDSNNTGLLLNHSHTAIVKTYDGVSNPAITVSWSRGEYHLKLVQSKADGSQYRVGNKRLGIDSSIQWGSWSNFDGSFNPLTYLRLAYNGTTPLHIKGGFASDESLSDAEIEHQYNIITGDAGVWDDLSTWDDASIWID